MAVPAGQFQNLYNGPMFEQRLTGGEDCPGYCLRKDEHYAVYDTRLPRFARRSIHPTVGDGISRDGTAFLTPHGLGRPWNQ